MSISAPTPAILRRRRRVVGMGIALAALLGILFAPQAFSLHFEPSPQNTWLLFLLSTTSFLAAVVLGFVLARQIVKLYAERQAHVLGAQFKTKLVIGALALSLTPVICMFGFTYGLINRTLDKWFSQPVVSVRDDSQGMLDTLRSYVADNAQSEALAIASSPDLAAGLRTGNWDQVRAALGQHRVTLQGGYAAVLDPSGAPLASFNLPQAYRPAPPVPGAVAAAQPLQLGGHSYLMARARLAGTGQIEVGMPVPMALSAQLARLTLDSDRYNRLARDRRSLKLIYTGYLLLLTLAILFGATWMALYLSKLVTVPVAKLAEATQEISRGNLSYRVEVRPPGGKDEIGLLVDSFNRMAGELETNRGQIEASQQLLQSANQELETRRRYTETLLENTPSAVISLDREHRIERVNPAVQRLFGTTQAHPQRLDELFDPASLRELQHLLRKAERWPAATGQLEVAMGARQLTLAVTVAAIGRSAATFGDNTKLGPRRRRPAAGYVLVLEDLTDLLRIQKTAAWREVAQRIAHEIRNPLTPIALSAQRIRRRLGAAPAALPEGSVIAECAATIENEVHSLQRLVDEFGSFARFPHAQPVACDLNEIIERALRAFDGRLDGIEVQTRLEPLPQLRLDPDDMKRVFINLIDNAAEAMHSSPYRQITLATQHLDGTVEAVVSDTGHGLPAGDKQRMFLPYYSTKQRGSGLGLAIVQRIVEESGGALRVEDNAPVGARFIVELPVESANAENGVS